MKVVIATLLVAIAGTAALWYWRVPGSLYPPVEEPTICTADAMLCPDGTYVGRSGPNCEFVCPANTSTQVSLYYYNPTLDQGAGGAQCSAAGLVAVTRSVPANTTLAEVVEMLLKGELTDEEHQEGIETEFPLEGVHIVSTEQVGHTVTLTFKDPQHKTSGGACRVEVLRLQIEATVKAFTGATDVRFVPNEVFQP